MIHLGHVRPGSTVEFEFGSYTGSTGASSATTGNATSDIQIYKDGGTTQRASASGVTFTVDFDSTTGINYVSIDLSDNTTADFYACGSRYSVFVAYVTIDSQTVRIALGSFVIGHPNAILNTTLATLTSQTSFTLAAGSADNNAYVGSVAIIRAAASGIQIAQGVVSAYTGASKTVTLAVDPAIYTMAAKDNISIMPRENAYSVGGTVWASGAITSASFAAGAIDAAAIATDAIGSAELAASAVAEIASGVWQDTTAGDFTTSLSVGKSVMNGVSLGTGLTIAAVSGAVGSVTGAAGSVTGAVGSVTGNVGGNVTGSVGSVTGAVGSVTGAVGSVATGGIAAASFAAGAINAAAIATDAIGASELAADAVAEIQAGLATPTNITAGTITTVTNLTNAPGAGDLTSTMKTSVQTAADAAVTANTLVNAIAGYIDTEVAAIKAKTDNLPASPAAVGSAMTLTSGERTSIGAALLASTLTQHDASALTTSTVEDALSAARSQGAGAWTISGTTLTLKNPDGTTFRSFTLDSSTSPTSRT